MFFFPVSSNVGFEEGDLGWMAHGAGLVRFLRQLFISKFSKIQDCFKLGKINIINFANFLTSSDFFFRAMVHQVREDYRLAEKNIEGYSKKIETCERKIEEDAENQREKKMEKVCFLFV